MSKYFLTALWLLVQHCVIAQSVSVQMGARGAGMGNATACTADEWASFNNVAGAHAIENTVIASAFSFNPNLPGGNRTALVGAKRLTPGVVSLGIFRFGDKVYSEQVGRLGFSNTFGLTSLGVQLGYTQYRAEGFNTKGLITVNFGGITQLTPHLKVGAYVQNINQPKISRVNDQRLPARMVMGVAAALSSKTLTSVEVEKEIGFPLLWRIGLSYQALSRFSFKTGFNLQPDAGFIGFGFHPAILTFDYALQYSFTLGAAHQISVGYKIQAK